MLGYGFLSNATCKFGTQADIGVTVDASSQLRCLSPPQQEQLVTLEITNNGLDFTDFRFQFTYYSMD